MRLCVVKPFGKGLRYTRSASCKQWTRATMLACIYYLKTHKHTCAGCVLAWGSPFVLFNTRAGTGGTALTHTAATSATWNKEPAIVKN